MKRTRIRSWSVAALAIIVVAPGCRNSHKRDVARVEPPLGSVRNPVVPAAPVAQPVYAQGALVPGAAAPPPPVVNAAIPGYTAAPTVAVGGPGVGVSAPPAIVAAPATPMPGGYGVVAPPAVINTAAPSVVPFAFPTTGSHFMPAPGFVPTGPAPGVSVSAVPPSSNGGMRLQPIQPDMGGSAQATPAAFLGDSVQPVGLKLQPRAFGGVQQADLTQPAPAGPPPATSTRPRGTAPADVLPPPPKAEELRPPSGANVLPPRPGAISQPPAKKSLPLPKPKLPEATGDVTPPPPVALPVPGDLPPVEAPDRKGQP